MRWQRFVSAAVMAALLLGPGALSAWACPFCGEANAVDDNRSKAFELSILFMLIMPALLLAGFGYGFYRLSRREAPAELADEAALASDS